MTGSLALFWPAITAAFLASLCAVSRSGGSNIEVTSPITAENRAVMLKV
jgi:hypothetical protein